MDFFFEIVVMIIRVFWMLMVLLFWKTPGIVWLMILAYHSEKMEQKSQVEKDPPKTWEEKRQKALQDCEHYANMLHRSRLELEKLDRVMEAQEEMMFKKTEYNKATIKFNRLVASHCE